MADAPHARSVPTVEHIVRTNATGLAPLGLIERLFAGHSLDRY